MVISATPAPPAPAQPLVQLVAGAPQVQPQPVVMYNVTSNDPVIAPTPALITAPTPAPAPTPLVVGPSHATSSNSYNFDPSGLTPAQQLAYAQAQQQHQQQHLEPYDVLCLQDRQQETQHRMAPSSTPDVAMESQYLAHRLRQSGGAGGSNR